jgi:hypothetical protein
MHEDTQNQQLISCYIAFRDNNTMSDSDYNHYDYEGYEDEDFEDIYDEHIDPDDDRLRINGVLVEELEDIKDYERGIMLAEKKVDNDVRRLGCTVFQRIGYDRCTERACWTVRILLEEEEINNEATDEENNNEATGSNEESYDALSSMDNYMYFLDVLERDMKDIKENFTKEMDVIKTDIKELLKSFRENVSGPEGADAGNHRECLQDIAAMSRKISPLKNAMENELGIRDGLHSNKTRTLLALRNNYRQRNEYTKKGYCGKDGKRYTMLVPKYKRLAERPSTPPTPNDDEE